MRVQLQEIAEKVDYGVTASATDSAVGPKFLRITDIQDGQVDWESVPWCECSDRSIKSSQLSAGDIVFARTGATTGKTYLIESCPTNAVFASYLIRLRLSERADPSYISHFFQTEDYWRQISSNSRGVAQPGVNASKLKFLEVPLPPLEEQKRIARILDAADALRSKRHESLAQIDALLQSIFADRFTMNGSGMAEEAVPIGQFAMVKGGKRLPKGHDYSDYETPYRYLRVANMKPNCVDVEALKHLREDTQNSIKRYKISEGDVVISIAGTIGVTVPIDASLDGVNLTENAAKIVPKDRGSVDPTYLSYALQTAQAQSQITGQTGKATIGKLALFRIEKIVVPLPPIEKQREFSGTVEKIRKHRAIMQAHATELDNFFAALQQKAFSGDL